MIGARQAISKRSKYSAERLRPQQSHAFCLSRKKGSAVRLKLQQLTMSIVNLTHLMETVTQMSAKQSMGVPLEHGYESYNSVPRADTQQIDQGIAQ